LANAFATNPDPAAADRQAVRISHGAREMRARSTSAATGSAGETTNTAVGQSTASLFPFVV
jgi:hypothetical protein